MFPHFDFHVIVLIGKPQNVPYVQSPLKLQRTPGNSLEAEHRGLQRKITVQFLTNGCSYMFFLLV